MERLAVWIYYISEEPQATIELKKYLAWPLYQTEEEILRIIGASFEWVMKDEKLKEFKN